MGSYQDLLLSAGGGIISSRQLAGQASCATIVIGLGGTGIACLKRLKQNVYEQLQPDDPGSEVQNYRHIKFLAVDTDWRSLDADGKINSLDFKTEYFDLCANTNVLIADMETVERHPEFAWLKIPERDESGSIRKRGLKIPSADDSYGRTYGVRQIGRLCLIEKAAAFVKKIEQLISEAKEGLPGSNEINIHIFTGMGGGTGSGIFLDVSYLVQQALENCCGRWWDALIFGYCFLPDVNLSVPQVNANPAISNYIKVNGFAAMKELDYCMNFESNGGAWDQEYGGFHIGPTTKPPFNMCHLVSATTIEGYELRDGFGGAMNAVSEFVMQFLRRSDMTMNSHIACYAWRNSAVIKRHDANYAYTLIGASSAVVPIREMNTYLSCKFFKKMKENEPTGDEITQIAKDNGLTYQHLQEEILQGTSCQLPVIELDYHLFLAMSEEDLGVEGQLILPEIIMSPFLRCQEFMINKIEANKQALTQEWSWKSISYMDETSASKVRRLYGALASVVSDPDFGPTYAADVLNGRGRKNLVVLLRGMLKQAQEEYDHYVKGILLRCEEIKQARTTFLHRRGFNGRRKLFNEFMYCVWRYYSDESKILMLEKLEDMLKVMIEQFITLHRECFAVYAGVVQNLAETFEKNYQILTDRETENPFVIPLLKIADMREKLDASVEEMDPDEEMKAFQSAFFKNHEAWNTGDEKKISKAVTDYMVHKFSEYTGKTLTDYLKLRFGTDDTEELENRVYQEIMIPLNERVAPMFRKESSYPIDTAVDFGYCSVADGSAVIRAAACRLCMELNPVKIVKHNLTDRISVIRCIEGVPMFAYKDMEEYLSLYNADREVGKHLYEGTSRDPRDWRYLSNLIPYSRMRETTEAMRKNAELYDRAVEVGIIRQRPDFPEDYQMVIMPSVEAVVNETQAAIASMELERIEEAEKKLEAFVLSAEPERLIGILNAGMSGHEDIVRRDYFMASSELLKLAREELDKKKALEKVRNGIKEAKVEAGFRGKNKKIYFDALMTGVIRCFGRIKVVYEKADEFGGKEEILLSNPVVRPYGCIAPIYQGFQTFCGLAGELRLEIEKLSGQRKNNGDPEIAETCSQLKALFIPEYLQMIQSGCRQQVLEKEAEIMDFVEEFSVELREFCESREEENE